jgi:pimeloyl-ACP methyl ester carboxylesterase
MIYYPTRPSVEEESRTASRNRLVPWEINGEKVGWIRQGRPGPPVVVFHGNAGNAADRGYLADLIETAAFPKKPAVYLFQYPGYGSRDGKPSEKAIMKAAQEAINALVQQNGEPVIVIGESLGTGVASGIAALLPEKVAGLLLLAPFNSLPAAAAHHYPWLPVGWLLRDRFDSVSALKNYHGPVVFVVAEQDEILPPKLGLNLYSSYQGPKLLVKAPGAGHNDLLFHISNTRWQEAWEFLHKKYPSGIPEE